MPEPVAFEQQRHVVGMLEIGLANDAGVAVGAAAVVRRVEAVDADGPHAAAGQLVESGAADAASAEDDGVVSGHWSLFVRE